MDRKSVLVLCPHPSRKGGVADFNRLLKQYFTSERISLNFHYVGHCENAGRFSKLAALLRDLVMVPLRAAGHNLVVLNPSLDFKAVIRDGFYHFVVKRLMRRQTLLFFHGWDNRFAQRIERSWKGFFNFVFNFDRALVLADPFRLSLIRWGAPSPKVNLETTMFEQPSLDGGNDPCKLIFLSRLVPGKGCLESVQAVEILAREFPGVVLYMAGDGVEREGLQRYVEEKGLGRNVRFAGWVEGDAKARLLGECGIMIFPSYSEGMPLSVLEAMGMGLAVVTRPVGGIPDVVVDGENGFLIGSLNPADFAEKVSFLLKNPEVWQKMSERNRVKANTCYEVRSVVKRLEAIYLETMKRS
jgi:glycosyltransferase involved in cell wall biosynthesis